MSVDQTDSVAVSQHASDVETLSGTVESLREELRKSEDKVGTSNGLAKTTIQCRHEHM